MFALVLLFCSFRCSVTLSLSLLIFMISLFVIFDHWLGFVYCVHSMIVFALVVVVRNDPSILFVLAVLSFGVFWRSAGLRWVFGCCVYFIWIYFFVIVISDFDFVLMFRLNVVRLMLYDLFCLFRIFGFFLSLGLMGVLWTVGLFVYGVLLSFFSDFFLFACCLALYRTTALIHWGLAGDFQSSLSFHVLLWNYLLRTRRHDEGWKESNKKQQQHWKNIVSS